MNLVFSGNCPTNFSFLYLVGIEGMKGLTGLMEHIIGNINHIINRFQPYGVKPVLKPFGGRCHVYSRNCESAVRDRKPGLLCYLYRIVVIVRFKTFNTGFHQTYFRLTVPARQPDHGPHRNEKQHQSGWV
jgi:hypothetical protein